MRKIILTVLVTLSLVTQVLAQNELLLKNIKTGNTRVLEPPRHIGLTTATDSIAYEYNYILKSITKDSIIVSDRAFAIADVKTIQYKIDENESAPVAEGMAAIICIVASPFAGITKDGYRFDRAAATLGAGVGLFGILAFATRNRHLRAYTITGVK